VFPPFLIQISDDDTSTEARREGGSAKIRPDEHMTSRVYDKKFHTGIQFLSGTLPFTAGEDKDLEHPTQEQEEWSTTTIDFEFPRGLKNLATTF
jgi:hypothetical protein